MIAELSASGIMNIVAAKLIAFWCAAAIAAPRVPIRIDTALKSPASAVIVTAIGIPISFLGGLFLMYVLGQSVNMISMVALAVIWAVAMPVLAFAAGHFDSKHKPAPMIPVQKIPEAE